MSLSLIRRSAGLAIALVMLLTTAPAFASQEMRQTLHEAAVQIKKVLKAKNAEEGPLAVQAFTGPSNFPTSSGPGIAEMLTEELQKEGVKVAVAANFGVKGSYSATEVKATNPDDARIGKKVLAVKLSITLVDGFDNVVGDLDFTRTIRGEATFLEFIPLDVPLPSQGTEIERDQLMRKAFTRDTKTAIKGAVVRSSADSPYGIEILVEDKPRAAEDKDKSGLAYLTPSIKRGDSYTVRLINDSDHDAAVQLRIDGLSLFSFSELRHSAGAQKGEPLYTVLLVRAKSSAIVPGWHVTNEKSDRFLVTEYAKSASANLKPTDKVGTISATFQAAWEVGGKAPEDEPGKKRGPGTGDATGRGPRVEKKYVEVTRELGIIRDSVTVRYAK